MMWRKHRVGFSLIELIVVLGILMLLYSLTMSIIRPMKSNTRKTVCTSNLKQLFAAVEMYQQDYGDYPFPGWRIYPQYVSAKGVFQCPAFGPDPPRDPSWMLVPDFPVSYVFPIGSPTWRYYVNRRGLDTPAILCIKHETDFAGEPYALIIRSNGRVESVSVRSRAARELGISYEW